MDLSTLLGLLMGVSLVLWGILKDSPLSAFFDMSSILIVFGGTFGAAMVQHSKDEVMNLLGVIKVAFLESRHSPTSVIQILVGMAEKARREGLLSLEEEAQEIGDTFLQKGVQLVVDGTDPELVRNVLEIEISFLEERHYAGQQIFETLGSYSPAFGMVGTLIGLIQMLGGLNDPEAVGPGMAKALITTFYGSVAANMVFLPMAGKLRMRSEREVLLRQMIVEGVLSIQAGENPRLVEEKLKSFLSPRQRQAQEDSQEVAGEETISA